MKKLLSILPLVILFCFTIACQDKAAMAELEKYKAQAALETQNIELIKKVMGEISDRNTAVFDKLYAPDYKYYFPSRAQTPFSRVEEAAQYEQSCAEESRHWGAARKAVNLFLRDALCNRYLAEEFNLKKAEAWMEIPLDSAVARGITDGEGTSSRGIISK